ncbi:MAG: hypothetical protein RMJ19_00780 [Gemmatales bacterium]|nr:hypothetical protein [Gemmatales bacterium]MDW8174179.1 hypothetical protein [Gemmatales bacterium]
MSVAVAQGNRVVSPSCVLRAEEKTVVSSGGVLDLEMCPAIMVGRGQGAIVVVSGGVLELETWYPDEMPSYRHHQSYKIQSRPLPPKTPPGQTNTMVEVLLANMWGSMGATPVEKAIRVRGSRDWLARTLLGQ